jgi:hypothetical protein
MACRPAAQRSKRTAYQTTDIDAVDRFGPDNFQALVRDLP